MEKENKITAIRRENLRTWINKYCDESQAKFIEQTDINQGELSGLLRGKSFGEKKARSLESKAGMPNFWLDTAADHELPPNSYKVNTQKMSYPPVFGKAMGGLADRLFTDEDRLPNGHDQYGEVYSQDQNAFITKVDGNSMFPKYFHGGFALVEPGTDPEIEDDVLIKVNTGQVMLKKLISRRGGVVLASYNEPEIYTYSDEDITWLYYVAYPVPSRKIKNRV